jgi:hypothetical protein
VAHRRRRRGPALLLAAVAVPWLVRASGAERVICWLSFGGLIPHERVMRSIQLFSSRVLPHVWRLSVRRGLTQHLSEDGGAPLPT